MATRWMTIGLPTRGEVHLRVDAQTGSGPWMVCVAVDGVFVIGIGMVVGIVTGIGGVGAEAG
jgi:hypothetical protein